MENNIVLNKEDDLDKIMELKKYFEVYKNELRGMIIDNSIKVDLKQLSEYSPTLYEYSLEEPESAEVLMEEALQSMLSLQLNILFFNINNERLIRKIRVDDINHLVSLKGIIKRITKVLPRTTAIVYECPSCGTFITVYQLHKKENEPKKCSCGRKGAFNVLNKITKNIQELNLEEIPEELEGKQPQQLRVYLEGDLTDDSFSKRLQPGRRIEIMGRIETLPPFMTQADTETNLSEFMMYANNIIPLEEDDELIITEEDIKQIKEIATLNPLDKLARSLVPEVYGNDEVKKAIVLQLVKGVSKLKSDGTSTREDIHILLSGEPGTAKSVTLKATNVRTPNSRMIVGTKTSRVGLGAFCVKDELSGAWGLEAGSIVLSSGSTLCLDELDKLPKENLSELLEPMSLGTVSVAKAGIFAKLVAKTSILAAANPIQGSYNLAQPIAKQIDLPSPILNRFDLIFIMFDKPNVEFDAKALEHIFSSYKEQKEPEIPIPLFKKYISYCRKLKPKLKDELLAKLTNFYTNLRQRSNKGGEVGLPINLRNMEGLIKLAEAHAKIRLSEWVEIDDLNVAKSLFMFCLRQVGIDNETGMIDVSRVTEKVPVSRRGKVEKLRDIIYQLSERLGKEIPYEEILRESEKLELKQWEVGDFLAELNRLGEIIEIRRGIYMLNDK